MTKRITWDEIDVDPLIVDYVDSGRMLGYKRHGVPVKDADGTVYWVESYQWKIQDDGSREPRHYRFVRLASGGVQSYPFDQPSVVQEFVDEQSVRTALVNYVKENA